MRADDSHSHRAATAVKGPQRTAACRVQPALAAEAAGPPGWSPLPLGADATADVGSSGSSSGPVVDLASAAGMAATRGKCRAAHGSGSSSGPAVDAASSASAGRGGVAGAGAGGGGSTAPQSGHWPPLIGSAGSRTQTSSPPQSRHIGLGLC